MSLNSIIITALKPLNVIVRFQDLLKEDGDPDTYITFFEYNQNGAVFADDEEQETAHFVQVDVLSKGNYLELVNQVKQFLKNAGLYRIMETEFYVNGTKFYHKVIRFSYTTETSS
jgi:hypothetical protein